MNTKAGILLGRAGGAMRRQGLLIGLALIIVAASIVERSFFTASNLLNILRQSTSIGIVSLGVTFVMMTGGMDLSVGSIVSLCSLIAVTTMNRWGQGAAGDTVVFLAIGAVILAGFAIGSATGGLIVAFDGRLGETFIITYGMQIVVSALAMLYTRGQFVAGSFGGVVYQWLSSGFVPIVLLLFLAGIMHIVLVYTSFGRQISFVGANIDCARMSGIRVGALRVVTYGICGACAGFASIIVTSRVFSASPLQGSGYELDAIAAAVVGGTSQSGGTGGIVNTLLGVLVLSVLSNALNVMGVDANAQLLVRGTIILLAVGLDLWNRGGGQKGAAS